MIIALALASLLHPLSVSSTRIAVDGARIEARIRVQDQTLVETLAIDADGDERVSEQELERARPAIASYVAGGWKLEGVIASGATVVLDGRLASATLTEGTVTAARGDERLVDLVWNFEAPAELTALHVEFTLFRESDPLHRDHAEIVWNGAEPAARVLWVEDPTLDFTPSQTTSGSTFSAFVHLGIEHIGLGWDHIAFVAALVLGARSLKSVLWTATAFTLAHSITLALAACELVSAPAAVVEPVIAASITWVALRNVVTRKPRAAWIEAFLFGLVHGLGFAGSIADTLAGERDKLQALVGFNLGVELGQIAIVLLLAGVLVLARRMRSTHEEEPALAPRRLRVAASLLLAALGVYWFVERTFEP